MKIDINKKYRTRDGRPAVIHAMDGPNEKRPIIGSIYNDSGDYWWTFDCPESGEYGDPKHRGSPLDLIEVREPREWEIRCHEDGSIGVSIAGLAAPRGETLRVREILD